ncbi:MAG: S1/P1 nuclease [Gemmatimonadota bacterium]
MTWLVLLGLNLSAPALLWGGDGHRIICEMAFQELNESARTKLRSLIATDTEHTRFSDSCVWADDVRSQVERGVPAFQRFARYNDSHFVNTPRGSKATDPAQCSKLVAGVVHPCVIDAIREMADSLKRSTSPQRRLESLKFLGHFVGDLHQPLHAGYPDDRGGNDIRVGIPGSPTERRLHSVWDSYLIQRLEKPWQTLAQELLRDVNPIDRTLWGSQLDPLIWANESYQLVEDDLYEDFGVAPNGGKLVDDRYVLLNRLTVERRLKQAAIRLARVLEQALGG